MYAKDNIRLYDFLRQKTEVYWLCFITYKGWGQCVAYIDHEDLMTTSIPKEYLHMIVKEVKFTKLKITNAYGRYFEVPVLEVEVDHETQD